MGTSLTLEIPHPQATGCALLLILPPQGGGPSRRARWHCRDSASAFVALVWACQIADEAGHTVGARMYDRYQRGLHGTPEPNAIGRWIAQICRAAGGPPAGLRDFMVAAGLEHDAILLAMTL